ncbi:hypothetical protein FPQ18DRAFT_309183 [Pyronema domesticum]|nr:hypothetical protein FPQ18DRAFT_309183 [Pyronema domesticum]
MDCSLPLCPSALLSLLLLCLLCVGLSFSTLVIVPEIPAALRDEATGDAGWHVEQPSAKNSMKPDIVFFEFRISFANLSKPGKCHDTLKIQVPTLPHPPPPPYSSSPALPTDELLQVALPPAYFVRCPPLRCQCYGPSASSGTDKAFAHCDWLNRRSLSQP